MTHIKQLLFTISVLFSFTGYSQNYNTIFFKDSISSAYKLMSASINTAASKKTFVLKNKQNTPSSYDFSNIHTLRFYALTKSDLTIRITYFSGSTKSQPIELNLLANKSGYIIEKFVIPKLSNDNKLFNYKEIDAIQIEVITENDFLIDEFSFQYVEDNIIVDGPGSLEKRFKEEKKAFRDKKSKEANSDFIKRKKALEAR